MHQKWLRLVVVTIAQAGGTLSTIQNSFYAAPTFLAVDFFPRTSGFSPPFMQGLARGMHISQGRKVRLLDADLSPAWDKLVQGFSVKEVIYKEFVTK